MVLGVTVPHRIALHRFTTSHLKIQILGQDQGGGELQAADILQYFEDLEFGANADIGPKDYFEMACTTFRY